MMYIVIYTSSVQFWTDTGRVLYYTGSDLIAGGRALPKPSVVPAPKLLSQSGGAATRLVRGREAVRFANRVCAPVKKDIARGLVRPRFEGGGAGNQSGGADHDSAGW